MALVALPVFDIIGMFMPLQPAKVTAAATIAPPREIREMIIAALLELMDHATDDRGLRAPRRCADDDTARPADRFQ
jgi:hypothetical protein